MSFKLSRAPCPPNKLSIQPSAVSPFRTSPSQLQEVTLDPDATNFSYMGMRSPGALTGGRSVKEIDEQLTNLKKENFNLKLRIYFLEERMGANFSTDKEDAIKKNIELMVELENIRKELEDKQELVCQAAKAMEIEEEEKKRELAERDREIVNLKEMLMNVKSQLQKEKEEVKQIVLCTEAFDLDLKESNADEFVKQLQNTINDLQEQLKKEREHAANFENMTDIAECVKEKCKNLETLVQEKDCKLIDMSLELNESNLKIVRCNEQINRFENDLLNKGNQLEEAITNCSQKDGQIREQHMQLKELKKLYEMTSQQKEKIDRKAEKYKSLFVQSETKNNEILLYTDNLKSRILNLERKLNTSVEEVKRMNVCQIIASTEQSPKSSNTDVNLFSVRDRSPTPEILPKAISPVNFSAKSLCISSSLSTMQSGDTNKNCSVTDISNEMQLSPEELLELKRNHFKACKIIKTMIQKKKDYTEQISRLHSLIEKRDGEISELQQKVAELSSPRKKSIKEKVSELKLTASLNPSANKENSMATEEMHLAEQYKQLTAELESKIEILTATLNEKDLQIERYKSEIQTKTNRIIDLEFELLTYAHGINESAEDKPEKQIQDQQEREQQIQKLETELRQRTCDLQGIVNNELWEKNRTIEKMQMVIKSKDQEINKLEKDMDGKELQLKILKGKINELGVHVNMPPSLIIADSNVGTLNDTQMSEEQIKMYLKERTQLLQQVEKLKTKLKNIPEHEEDNQALQLKQKNLCEELEKSEQLRQETQEICSILSARLEELCQFLNSLLKQKSVLGFLGNEQSCQLQLTLNRSLELSRLLSHNISLNPDQSLLQLSNITNLLNLTCNDNFNSFLVEDNSVLSIIPSDVTLTYRSHLNISCGASNEQNEVIKVLREQVDNLKYEIAVRDVELAKKQTIESVDDKEEAKCKMNLMEEFTSTTLKNQNVDNHSESESWSEPDRTVSLARIGLQEESLRRLSSTSSGRRARFAGDVQLSTESTEEEQGRGSIRTPSKRSTLAESRQTIIVLHEQVCELEIKLKEKENELLASQVAYYESDNKLKQEQANMEEMKIQNGLLSENLDKVNQKLIYVEQHVKEVALECTQLNEQIQEAANRLEEAVRLKCESEQKIVELQVVVDTLDEFKRNVEATNEVKYKELLNTLNEMEIEKNRAIESARHIEKVLEKARRDMQTAEAELKHMYEKEKRLREELESDLRKTKEQYEDKLKIMETDYKIHKNNWQETILQMEENYANDYVKKSDVENLKLIIDDCGSKMHLMEQNEMELKTKVLDMRRKYHEKICEFHKELDNAALKYSEVVLEKSKLKNETVMYEQQLQKFHMGERELLRQISQLEQQLKMNNVFSTSLPNNFLIKDSIPIPTSSTRYRRQLSDQSGYTSEDIVLDEGDPKIFVGLLETADQDHERSRANSSPDLGIESDHGRFSSLETNINIPRPLLPSLELAQSMNSLLDPVQDTICVNEWCHKKVKQLLNENVELRKRLLRKRRALEDTLTRLKLANKQKQEIEKTICNQIHKTSQVLRKAKANLDSGSESDIIKK